MKPFVFYSPRLSGPPRPPPPICEDDRNTLNMTRRKKLSLDILEQFLDHGRKIVILMVKKKKPQHNYDGVTNHNLTQGNRTPLCLDYLII